MYIVNLFFFRRGGEIFKRKTKGSYFYFVKNKGRGGIAIFGSLINYTLLRNCAIFWALEKEKLLTIGPSSMSGPPGRSFLGPL